jgi:threonine aldolase
VERLAEDHENARVLAAGLAELPGIEVAPAETNIVLARVPDAFGLTGRLVDAGVEVSPVGPGTVRCVTHLDVNRAEVESAIAAFARALRAT